ncbi:ATP-binding protein [Streptomyces sp. NRRL F-4489]|uniref:ATP-binding protein n=1 Tax=Streptomyces sp. NRRL F-4489 TaxID=1609095 RepID=UPI00131C49A8|nr:ATP-binding protein [Streptomyces sp. NRRL F-4489]
MRQERFKLAFNVDPARLRSVRKLVASYVRRWELEALAEPAEAVVTELLTNVLHHADGYAVLTLAVEGQSLFITVRDRSSELPVLADPGWASLGGRGMRIVEQLSDKWEAIPVENGKDVCATLIAPAELPEGRRSLARCSA